jgi:hypothetical protein
LGLIGSVFSVMYESKLGLLLSAGISVSSFVYEMFGNITSEHYHEEQLTNYINDYLNKY